jgi:hypothetical protein
VPVALALLLDFFSTGSGTVGSRVRREHGSFGQKSSVCLHVFPVLLYGIPDNWTSVEVHKP